MKRSIFIIATLLMACGGPADTSSLQSAAGKTLHCRESGVQASKSTVSLTIVETSPAKPAEGTLKFTKHPDYANESIALQCNPGPTDAPHGYDVPRTVYECKRAGSTNPMYGAGFVVEVTDGGLVPYVRAQVTHQIMCTPPKQIATLTCK